MIYLVPDPESIEPGDKLVYLFPGNQTTEDRLKAERRLCASGTYTVHMVALSVNAGNDQLRRQAWPNGDYLVCFVETGGPGHWFSLSAFVFESKGSAEEDEPKKRWKTPKEVTREESDPVIAPSVRNILIAILDTLDHGIDRNDAPILKLMNSICAHVGANHQVKQFLWPLYSLVSRATRGVEPQSTELLGVEFGVEINTDNHNEVLVFSFHDVASKCYKFTLPFDAIRSKNPVKLYYLKQMEAEHAKVDEALKETTKKGNELAERMELILSELDSMREELK